MIRTISGAGCTPAITRALDNGTSIISHYVALAVGHETQPARGRGIAVRVGSALDTPLDPEDPVIILGSGLSMVDAWLSLAQAEHRGPILVVSRNGLLPTGHRDDRSETCTQRRCERRASHPTDQITFDHERTLNPKFSPGSGTAV